MWVRSTEAGGGVVAWSRVEAKADNLDPKASEVLHNSARNSSDPKIRISLWRVCVCVCCCCCLPCGFAVFGMIWFLRKFKFDLGHLKC